MWQSSILIVLGGDPMINSYPIYVFYKFDRKLINEKFLYVSAPCR